MRPFDDSPKRAAELEAYHALWNLWRSSQRMLTSVQNWESACRMLETYYTVKKARQDPEICEMRIRYLEIAEPQPQLADFVQPPAYDRLPDAQRQLAHARYQYQLARRRHPVREQQRLKELETTRALRTAVKAAEARARVAEIARRREWQLSRWPKDVVLESEIYNLDGVAAQVDRQNAKIEAQVVALTDLLRAGLRHLPDVSASALIDGDRADTPAELAARAESVLTAMPLPRGISPKPAVEYVPAARQLVVEYELPTVDVVPRAKAYRYVKTRETVVETARPAGQVKALYASTIAQLTLLALATVFELDGEHQFEVVIFKGVVDTLDPNTGQPIRPCLISVRVNAETFAGIYLADVDPSVCLKRLSAVVSPNPTQFVPVRPLAE
jgi:restriction system protein